MREKLSKLKKEQILRRWKEIIFITALIIETVAIVGFALLIRQTYRKMDQLSAQLSYLSDTNSVMLSDIGNMKTDFEETMESESSMLSSWNISLKDMNFTDNTYTVSITIVPKEYTESTTAAIYFGTHSFPLDLEDYQYVGTAELSLGKSYEGNVTVLFSDGQSRKTEVLSSYSDVKTDLTQVISGTLYNDPVYEDGTLHMDVTGNAQLDGGDFVTFNDVSMIVEADGRQINVYDLEAMAGQESEELNWLSYSFTIDDDLALEAPCSLKIYLQAYSTTGYRFTWDLFSGDVKEMEITEAEDTTADTADDPVESLFGTGETESAEPVIAYRIDPDSVNHESNGAVYDLSGGCYLIP